MQITKDQLSDAFVCSVGMVEEFHRIFGHPVGEEPVTSLSEGRAIERFSYLLEEFDEGLKAALAGDKVEALDAIADAIYFACGNLVECGIVAPDRLTYLINAMVTMPDNRLEQSFSSVANHLEKNGWQRFIKIFMIQGLAEFSTLMVESLEEDGEPQPVNVVECSSAFLAAALFTINAVFGADPKAVIAEVHRSNMSKLLPADIESDTGCRAFMEFNGCKVPPSELSFTRLEDKRWVAIHTGSKKIIKNPLLSKPDLTPFI